MSLFFRLLISVIISLTSYVSISAAGFVDFTLAPKVYLSGASSDVRFDVAGALYDSGSPIPAPHIVTGTRTFSGAFYLSGAGWVLMNTGSYNVKLDCGTQSLTGITANCTLSGTAWSETIGDIVFDRRVQYLTGGTLSGVVWTWIGEQSLSGIMLPLRRTELTDTDYTSVANHETQIDILFPHLYTTSGGSWNISFTPNSTFYTEQYPEPSYEFDLSIASDYDLIIKDPNGSITTYVYTVENGAPSMSLYSDSITKKESFCLIAYLPDNRCPDGATLMPTSIEHTLGGIPGHTTVADGIAEIDGKIIFRDAYGNEIHNGNVEVIYDISLPSVQISLGESGQFGAPIPGFGVNVVGDLMNNYDDTISFSGSVAGSDLVYSFSAFVPGSIALRGISYAGVDTGITTSDLTFTPWFTVTSVTPSSDIRIGTGSEFLTNIEAHSTRADVTPILIQGLSIGDGNYAAFSDLKSDPMMDCQANKSNPIFYIDECNWTFMGDKLSPTVLARTLSPVTQNYTFSGMYTTFLPIAYVPPEPVHVFTYFTYTIGGIDYIYPSFSGNLGTSLFQKLRIRILGQTRTDGWYGGLQVGTRSKTDYFNQIRKNVAILTRNRTDYSKADYTYTGGQNNIFDHDFDKKRTIIVEGEDVVINRNILAQDRPLAIIALKDRVTGSGGMIRIATGVTDIHATLIAENSIRGTGSLQLYIHGSIISNNTLGGAGKTPRECPYFDDASCSLAKAKRYDLEYLRDTYTDIPANWASGATAAKYRDTSVIIEYDPRIISDPPPGLEMQN